MVTLYVVHVHVRKWNQWGGYELEDEAVKRARKSIAYGHKTVPLGIPFRHGKSCFPLPPQQKLSPATAKAVPLRTAKSFPSAPQNRPPFQHDHHACYNRGCCGGRSGP